MLCLTGVLVVGQLYAVIPLYGRLAESWDVSSSAAGWTATTFGLGYAAGFLLFGPLADRFDRRGLLVVGLVATAVTTAAVAAAPDLTTGSAARVAQGLAAATFAPAAFAYVARHVDPDRRVTAMTCLTSSFLSAGVLGQVYSQLLSGLGWRAVFAISGIGLVGCAVLVRLTLRRDAGTGSASLGSVYRTMGGLTSNPVVLLLLGATATVLSSFVAVYTALQLAGPVGIAGDNGALLGLRASALPAMAIVPLATPLLVRLAAGTRVAAALALAAVIAALTALVSGGGGLTPVLTGLLLFPLVLAVVVAAPALVEALGAQAGPARGAAVALYTFALFVGASLGSPLASALLDADVLGGGFAGVVAVVSGLLAVGAALAAAAHRKAVRS
ncbi:MFS transporter [Actinosynnema sp. NPDC059797]